MKKTLTFLALIALFALTHATSTDGNYTLLQYDLQGSGTTTTLTDGNYVAFAEVGEPVASENLSDANIVAAAGFFGEPFLAIAAAAAEAVTRIIFLPIVKNVPPIALVTLAIIVAASILGTMFFVKQKKEKKAEGEEK